MASLSTPEILLLGGVMLANALIVLGYLRWNDRRHGPTGEK